MSPGKRGQTSAKLGHGHLASPDVLSRVITPPEESLPARLDNAPDINVWSTIAGEPCAFSGTHGTRHWLLWPGVASFRFTADSDSVTAIPYTAARLDVIRTTYYHSVLPLALQARGREGLHASAILTDKGVVGFCGKAQVGKSTLAYALQRCGLTAWSDDALVWETCEERPAAIKLPFEVRLRPSALSFFGLSSSSEVQPAGRHDAARASMAAVFVLTRRPFDSGAQRVEIRRLGGGRALTTLLDHAHCFNPYDAARTRQMMVNYLAFLSRVPVFEVRFQPALALLPELADAITGALRAA